MGLFSTIVALGAALIPNFATEVPPVRATTYNVYYGTPDSVVKEDLLYLMSKSHVLTLQEVGGKKAVLDAVAKAKNYRYYRNRGLAVMWNPRVVRKLGQGSYKLTERTYVGEEGAGTSHYAGPHYITWVRFHHKPSRVNFIAASTHVIPSVYLEVRAPIAQQHIQNTVKWVKSRKVRRVLIGGDWNMVHDHTYMFPLYDVGMRNNHSVLGALPTHSLPDPRRAIDMFWARRLKATRHLNFVRASDHAANYVEFR